MRSYELTDLTVEVKDLKNIVHDLEIDLLGDLKEIHDKLVAFTSTVKSLSKQAKLKTLDALPNLLNKATQALNKFAIVLESAIQKTGDTSVPSLLSGIFF
ncbi:hypothetical protein Tco_0062775 [Tanacetum coccineum]